MNKKEVDNLKIIYGIDLIVFGIILACHLFIDSFNFSDYWLLFLTLPALADLIVNKFNVFNVSLFIISTSILSYFIFDTGWACIIVIIIMLGVMLLISRFTKKEIK